MKWIVMFFCILLFFPSVLSADVESDAGGNPFSDPIVTAVGSGTSLSSTIAPGYSSIPAASGTVGVPAGAQVSVVDGILKSDHSTTIDTSTGTASGIDDVTVRRDGSFDASRADHVGKCGVDLLSVAPVSVSAGTVSFGKGDVLFKGSYFGDVQNGEIVCVNGIELKSFFL